MRVHELIDILDGLCGKISSDDSRILFGSDKWTMDAVGVCWYANLDQIRQMVAGGVDTVICRVDIMGDDKAKQELRPFLKDNNILVYRIGRKWDLAPNSAHVILSRIFGMTGLKKIPYGIVGSIEAKGFKRVSENAERITGTHIIETFGNPGKQIYRVGVLNRSGVLDNKSLAAAVTEGADAVIVPEITTALRNYAESHDISLIGIGYYSSENHALKTLAEDLAKKLEGKDVPVKFFDFKPKWFV